jgi:hypothetical protein
MDSMKKWLSSAGGFLALAGALSIVLQFIHFELVIFMWIDHWGPTVGWVIRIGVTVIGLVMLVIGWAMGGKKSTEQT